MKKLKGLIIMLLISLSLLGMTACKGDNNSVNYNSSATYEQISAKQAKEIMDTESDYIILFGVHNIFGLFGGNLFVARFFFH